MMFERGFKAWCERTAAGLRRELGLRPTDPLDPGALAEHLDVELLTPRDLPALPQDVLDQLLTRDPWGWSAVALGRVVIFNPRKSPGRRASDITHELAHVILDHAPGQIILSHDGQIGVRSFEQKQEDEANWLAWSLLLPREALVYCKKRGLGTSQIARTFGVTEVLVRFRISVAGVDAQFERRQGVAKRPTGRQRKQETRTLRS